MEIPNIKSPDDLRKILEETGADLSGVEIFEHTMRIGPNDIQGVMKVRPDGNVTFYPYPENDESGDN